MEAVKIRKIKRPDGVGVWGAYFVADDEHGSWLYTPRGSRYRGTKDGMSSLCAAGDPTPPGVSVMHLVPGDQWWFARWQVDPRGIAVLAIDVCLPPQRVGGDWSYVDLELDLFKSSEGVAGLFDEDDFARAVEAGSISHVESVHASAVAADLKRRVLAHDRLFDEIGWSRYREFAGVDLPSLVDV